MRPQRSLLISLFLLAPVICAASYDIPQPGSTTLGITGGYDRTFHSGFLDGPFVTPPVDAAASGFHAGLAFEQRLGLRISPDLPNAYLHLILTVDHGSSTFEFGMMVDPWYVILAPGLVPVRRSVTLTHQMMKLDLLLRQMILPTGNGYFSGFSISAGPTIAYLGLARARHTLTIVDPDTTLRFIPGYGRTLDASERRTMLQDVRIDGVRRIRYGIKGALSFETALIGDALVLAPTISYDRALGSQREGADWRMDILQASLDVRVDLGRIGRLFASPDAMENNPL